MNARRFPLSLALLAGASLSFAAASVRAAEPAGDESPPLKTKPSVELTLTISSDAFYPRRPTGSIKLVAVNQSEAAIEIPESYDGELVALVAQGRQFPLRLFDRARDREPTKVVPLPPGSERVLFDFPLGEILRPRDPQQMRDDFETGNRLLVWDWVAHAAPPASPILAGGEAGMVKEVTFVGELALNEETTTSNAVTLKIVKDFDPTATLEFGDWTYRFTITKHGTRSQGMVGRLSLGGSELNAENCGELERNDYINTPWGPLYWWGPRQVLWNPDGWLSFPDARAAMGDRITPPGGNQETLILTQADRDKTATVAVGKSVILRLPCEGSRVTDWKLTIDGQAVEEKGRLGETALLPPGWSRVTSFSVIRLLMAAPGKAVATAQPQPGPPNHEEETRLLRFEFEVVAGSE